MSTQGLRAAASTPVDRRYVSVAVLEHGASRPLVPGTRVELRFSSDRIVAMAGGNTLDLDVRIDPDRLVAVGELGTTLAGYPEPQTDQDRWLGTFLVASPTWTLDEDLLTLTAGDTVIVLADLGAEPTELWGRTFVSVAVTPPLVAGTAITLTFRAPDRLRANAGCNFLSFHHVEVGETRLRVADVSTTEMACSPERMAQDEWLIGVLSEDPEYTVTGASLTLIGGATEIVLVREPDR